MNIQALASNVRRSCISHLPVSLSPDEKSRLIDAIEMAIGRTLGALDRAGLIHEPQEEPDD